MAKNHFSWTIYKALPNLLPFCVPLIALIAFSGQEIFWVSDAYDGWRIFEVIFLLLIGLYGIFIHPSNTSLPSDSNKYININLPFLVGLIIISIWQSEHSARAAADAALYGLLGISIWVQAKIFYKHPSIAPHIAAWLAILPILTVIFLPIRLMSDAFGSTNQEWHQLFSNIRMFDDALLPCLFLLWQRPAWLADETFKAPLLKNAVTLSIFTLSVLYILALWYDGARAVLLSTMIGLGFIVIFRRDLWPNLRLPIFTLITASLVFFILQQTTPDLHPNPILRTGSSGRYELWQKTITLWFQHPLFGVGGDNFVISDPWRLNGHPHNIALQFVSEYGFTGILAILLLIPISIQIFKFRQTLPAFAIAAMIAVIVDSLFSGILVYPLSQILGLWPLAWLIAMLPTHPHPASTPTSARHATQTSLKFIFNSWQQMLKIATVLAILAMLYVHAQDFICIKCSSVDAYNAPRFWQYGRALHLEP